ncbi:hypothetical protein [Pseudomonas baltica]|uniref:hypothetical protein n=1 Tax=Pseudomonas baltica TaxID=2762576 RepID=UPI00289831F8|nr:hypothetical protein [Pseudomonas baltica]
MIDIDAIRKLSPQDGDIFQLPEDAPQALAHELIEALTIAKPGLRAVVIRGDIRRLDTGAMNAAGWYRA